MRVFLARKLSWVRWKALVLLVVGSVVALWTASRYVWALGRAMNAVFGVEEGRPPWRLLPVGVVLTALLIVLVAAGGLALVFTGPIAETVGGLGRAGAGFSAWSPECQDGS